MSTIFANNNCFFCQPAECPIEDINNFPCDDLLAIDQLWEHHSQRRFGFSVQKQIYQKLGGTRKYSRQVWEAFGEEVGWRKSGLWLSAENLNFSTYAQEGHLPVWGFWFFGLGGASFTSLISRISDCNL